MGQFVDDSCRFGTVGLGSSDGSSTEKERREEKEKKKRQSKQWSDAVPQGHSRDQEWDPSLSLPISPVFYIEHPCRVVTGVLACQLCMYIGYCFFCLSFSFDLFPFRAPEDGGSSRR